MAATILTFLSLKRSFEPRNGLWGALLADRLQRVCDVIGRGFSGYTSRTCNIILPRLFSAENISDIEAFVICLGANDSSDKDSDTNQHVPIHEYSKNLEDIVNYLQLIGLCKKKIVLMTPPPYYHEKYAAYCAEVGRSLPLRDNRTVSEYAEACFKVGQKCEVDVVNLYQEMIKDENWPRYLIDGLHFSHAGSVLVYALLWPHIAKRVQVNKMILPSWNEIDLLHPEKDLKKH
ncbi:isoamyl acetate-hydrolyzing esterase 1 homolog isoform X2 [Stegodyphus dumicola]|uniref:isoamyl acetate-hydrolyzing esterase 1 homolog isoform X2 n=1 Tax=Stegodyphus dumicola TaxID=202533 RepID=UPI0015AA3FF7|nr:isoamyl acetate-hydrolyzing esterase 1 homolog isoform X2 [Stegodyphus dumicola]